MAAQSQPRPLPHPAGDLHAVIKRWAPASVAVASLGLRLVANPRARLLVLGPLLSPFVRADGEGVGLELVAHVRAARLVHAQEPLVVPGPG